LRGVYNTVQKQYLYEIIKNKRDKQFTVDEIIKLIPDNKLGRSTVYRLLANLVNDGVIRRYTADGSRCYVYQLAEDDACDYHFHLKCVDCGKVIHIKENLSDSVSSEIMTEYNFKIDERKTVFLGQCKECANI